MNKITLNRLEKTNKKYDAALNYYDARLAVECVTSTDGADEYFYVKKLISFFYLL